MHDSQYIQDSLGLRVEDEFIPAYAPPVDTRPIPRAHRRQIFDARTHGVPELKRCRTCNEVKPSSEFNGSKQSRDGLNFRCRVCSTTAAKAHYHNNPEMYREAHLRRTYGITLEQFESLLNWQGNACGICQSVEHGGKGWHVDHDHDTGAIRGILCSGCNVALGSMKDSSVIAAACAEYLRKHGK